MADLYDPKNNETVPGNDGGEEDVVSVWHGSGNMRFFRRRYFDGFTFYETVNEKGKREMHNVYTGTWYTQELSPAQRKRNRVAYVCLCLLGAALLLLGATRVIPINSRVYGAAPAFAGLIGFGWMLVSIYNEFTVPQRRTIGEYRAASLSLRRSGLLCAVCGALTFLLTVVFGLIDGVKPVAHVLAAASELFAAAAGYLVRRIEGKVEYSQERSKDAGKYTM